MRKKGTANAGSESPLPAPRPARPRRGDGARRIILQGAVAATVFFGGLVAWTVGAPIESAVVVQATVEVESNRKAVQHLEGGIVKAIHVRENATVDAGDLLVEFDETAARTTLSVVEAQLADQIARAARLMAERAGAARLTMPPLPEDASPRFAARLEDALESQRDAFEARREARTTKMSVLHQRKEQLLRRIDGREQQIASVERQIALLDRQLKGAKKLLKKGLTPLTRVLELERQIEELNGQVGAHNADIAQTEEALGEAELEIVQARREFKEGTVHDYAEARTEIAELQERRIAALDQLRRTKVRAPRDGRVLNLSVHTVGGVVGPREPIMMIVPDDDPLVLTAQVSPSDIDKIRPGADVRVKFSASGVRTAEELDSKVISVSADSMSDPDTGTSYFRAVIELPARAAGVLRDVELSPGMPAEAYIRTGTEPAIAYLVKPLTDILGRAFREE
ncbi:MAG: HlyD family type I secretion periplasmic adaptor subunit [Alphaproteobacteria bacterium]